MNGRRKKCFKCGTEKPISEFYKHAMMKDGYLNKCKLCAINDEHLHRKNNRDKYQQYEKLRAQDPVRKAKAAEYQRKYRAKNKQKYKARTLIGNMLRDGKIQKTACEICGLSIAQAHHENYANPKKVRWLCETHHNAVHNDR